MDRDALSIGTLTKEGGDDGKSRRAGSSWRSAGSLVDAPFRLYWCSFSSFGIPTQLLVQSFTGFDFDLKSQAAGDQLLPNTPSKKAMDQQRFQLYGGSVIGRRVLGGIPANF